MNQKREDSAKLAAVSTCSFAQLLSPSWRAAAAMLSMVRCVACVRTPGGRDRGVRKSQSGASSIITDS